MKWSSEEIKEVISTDLCVSFYISNIISCSAYLCFLIPLLDGWCSGFIHSGEDFSLVFSYYENEFPRHIGHGHSPSSSFYLCSVCITSLWNQSSPKEDFSMVPFNRQRVSFLGFTHSFFFLKNTATSYGIIFLLRCLTAVEKFTSHAPYFHNTNRNCL